MAPYTPQDIQRILDAVIDAFSAVVIDQQPAVTLPINATIVTAAANADLVIRVSPCPRLP